MGSRSVEAWRRLVRTVEGWNVTDDERAAPHPASAHVPAGGRSFLRAVDVDADAATVFRWLCQLKVAPYSYDLVDNLGRRSPRSLTPGADDLALGQRFLIGPLVDFERDHRLVLVASPAGERVFGPVAMSYEVVPGLSARSRIVAEVAVGPPRGAARGPARALDRAWQSFLGVGDLVMLRRQLLTLKALAEGAPRG